MKVEHRNVDIIQQLGMIFDRVAAGEEDNDLLLSVFTQEGEQQEKPPIGGADDIALRERCHRASCLLLVNVDLNGAWA